MYINRNIETYYGSSRPFEEGIYNAAMNIAHVTLSYIIGMQ